MLWPLSVVLVANTNGRLAIPALAGLLVATVRRATERIGNCKKKEIMQGATPGQRKRRPRTRWQDNITKRTGLTGDRLLRSVKDRRQWRKIIHKAANPRIEDG